MLRRVSLGKIKKMNYAVPLRISTAERRQTFFLHTGLCATIMFSLGSLTHHTKQQLYVFVGSITEQTAPQHPYQPTDHHPACVK